MKINFELLNENPERTKTRSYMFNFFLPCTGSQAMKTFFYTGINDWNALPNSIKEIKSEDMFKEKLKMHLMKEMENDEKKQFTKK